MGEPNAMVGIIRSGNDNCLSTGSSSFGQTGGSRGQREAIIQLSERLQYESYNSNRNIIDKSNDRGMGSQCNTMPTVPPIPPMPRLRTRTTVSIAQRDRVNKDKEDRESQFASTGSKTSSKLTGNTNHNISSAGIAGDAIGNGLVVVQVGRGKHPIHTLHNTTTNTTIRADHYCIGTTPLAAPVVPVSESKSNQSSLSSLSAFDNKAFSCDGEPLVVDAQDIQTHNLNNGDHCLSNDALTNSVLNSDRLVTTTCAKSNGLLNNESISSSSDCLQKLNNTSKTCFMITRNESECALKGQQYCSSSDDNSYGLRARNNRSTRSSVVKHIGVFYSDLCDVIKAMTTGGNQSNNNNINNNGNNANNGHNNSRSVPQQTIASGGQSQQQQHNNATNACHQRTSISSPIVSHNVNNHVPQQQQQQQSSAQQSQSHPIQAQTCVTSSQMSSSHVMSSQTTLRSPTQSQSRLNESQVHDLPDILNSHLPPPPPPYSTLPSPSIQLPPLSPLPPLAPIRAPPPPPPPPPLPTGRPPLPSRRILHAPTAALAHCSRPNYLRPTCAVSETETSTSKTCLSCNGVSIRWFILLIAFIGLLCSIIGTILGALRSTGREHLTLALLMIGVGIILITVSGIAWRLTSTGPTWRSILGLHELHQQQSLCNGSSLNEASRRFVPRVPAPYGRTGTHHHPYGAMFYPEFQYRPPPPSYQASMQEYRLRLLLLDRTSSHPQSTSLSPVSPPPTYRSSAASSMTGTLPRQSQHNTIQRATSRPPSYRTGEVQAVISTAPSYQTATTQTVSQPQPSVQSQPSATQIRQSTSLTTTTGASTAVSTTMTTSQTQTPLPKACKPMTQKPSHYSSQHDINRVTILQTTNTSQVCTPNGVNIVAITPTTIMSANTPTTTTTIPNLSTSIISNNEVQILAHV
ncbi:type-2 histone deacetylase 1-like [Oppia nitens]|uniref:type-2 histone deacetylase 1-like n=1 Tax=Oppia nitens TaxID=1686743 RepID=UPI0023D98CFA|nr:type-2 histone deacetylase 1-like [Oppia nitens]XP_054160805.1 type-2 histone deacetylase 1-like [Oppia nitens]XP_054160806.1 type-2 histone deacetylase 1-like [Oppia nitens]